MARSRRVSLHLVVVMLIFVLAGIGQSQFQGANSGATEAPTGFDDQTNGLVDQSLHLEDENTFFKEVDTDKNGLGPVFNQTSCAACHQNPTSGGQSQVTELRAGHLDAAGNFANPVVAINNGKDTISGRSLINQFAICPQAQETVPDTETIRALRMSLNTLGDGFIEAIDDQTLLAIARSQAQASGGVIHGQPIMVDVLEAAGVQRVGRFGWKDQQASVLSFAADAYLNEQGITSRLLPQDVTSVCDKVADPEDNTTDAAGFNDIDHFAQFIRATKAPPVDAVAAAQPDAQAGSKIFSRIGCDLCHVSSITTAPAGTAINGSRFIIPEALGNKIIHPFSDFLLHDVGTGDGIVQNGGQATANKLRTPPLWGLRVRTQIMHDGKSSDRSDAILRHGGEASEVISRYRNLTDTQKAQLITFLNTL